MESGDPYSYDVVALQKATHVQSADGSSSYQLVTAHRSADGRPNAALQLDEYEEERRAAYLEDLDRQREELKDEGGYMDAGYEPDSTAVVAFDRSAPRFAGAVYGSNMLPLGPGAHVAQSSHTVELKARQGFVVNHPDMSDPDEAADFLTDKQIFALRGKRDIGACLAAEQPVFLKFPHEPVQHMRFINIKVEATIPASRLATTSGRNASTGLADQVSPGEKFAPCVVEIPASAVRDQLSHIGTFPANTHHLVPHEIHLESYSTKGSPYGFHVQLCSKKVGSSQTTNWLMENTVAAIGKHGSAFQGPLLYPDKCGAKGPKTPCFIGLSQILNQPSWRRWATVNIARHMPTLPKDQTNSYYRIEIENQQDTRTRNPIVHRVLQRWPEIYKKSEEAILQNPQLNMDVRDLVENTERGRCIVKVPCTVLDNHMHKVHQLVNPDCHMMCTDNLSVAFIPACPNGWQDFRDVADSGKDAANVVGNPPVFVSVTFSIKAAVCLQQAV